MSDNIEVYLNKNKQQIIKMEILDYKVNEEGNMILTNKLYEENTQIGSVLLNFIQNDLESSAKLAFRFYGFKTLLSVKEQQELLNASFEELNQIMDKLYNKHRIELENYRNQLIDIIEYCIFNEDEKLKNLRPIEKLAMFCNTIDLEKFTILKHNEFTKKIIIRDVTSKSNEKHLKTKIKENNHIVQEIYEIDNFYNLLFLDLYFIFKGKIQLKKCKNCGKYFLTPNSAVMYCSNIFEGNKTCKEIGASKVFIKNLDKDEVYNLYRKTYKKKQALAKVKGGSYAIEYDMFKIRGKEMKDSYKLNEITKHEFIKWINAQ